MKPLLVLVGGFAPAILPLLSSALNLPPTSSTLSLPQSQNISTPGFPAYWPFSTPFEVPILDSGTRDILNFTWYEFSPTPPDRDKILNSIKLAAERIISYHKLANPMASDLVDVMVGDIVLNLRNEVGQQCITYDNFLQIMNTVSRLFRNNGPVWFDSQIERGGKVIAFFELLF